MSTATLSLLLPEIMLVMVATLIYVGGAFTGPRSLWSWVAGITLVAAGFVLAEGRTGDVGAAVAADGLGNFVRWLGLGLGLLLVMLSSRSALGQPAPEEVGSLLLAIAGVMLVGASQDLVMMFVALELISIPTYVLLGLSPRNIVNQEPATKYFLLSILSSALMLYGFSFLYGVGGSTELSAIAERLESTAGDPAGMKPLAVLALVLIFGGLAFRLAAVPFHFYAPDVYQGTTHANAALLSALPKVAGLAAISRLLLLSMPGVSSFGWGLALALAAITMTLGNVVALWQNHVRRLMAYSSIAHAGYMLIGLTVAFAAAGGAEASPAFDGMSSAMYYLTVYAVATTGAFAALAYLGRTGQEIETVDDLAGAGRVAPMAGICLAICLFSLAGIPPLAGFWGKLALFAGALGLRNGAVDRPIEMWLLALAILGALNAAVAAAYYLRLVAVMFFHAPLSGRRGQGGPGAAVSMLVATLAVLWMGLYPGPIWWGARRTVPPVVESVPSPAASANRAEQPILLEPGKASAMPRFAPFSG